MKIFAKKGVIQKITIIILAVVCINFIAPNYSNASFSVGGVLATPFVDFFCMIGDACINLMQKLMTFKWGAAPNDFSLNTFLLDADSNTVSSSKPSEFASEITIDTSEFTSINGKYKIPQATYSPEQIFKGDVAGLDINFINPRYNEGPADKLQETIAAWYVNLRNLATVGLLCMLAYVGIRMLLSSTAPDKAKYKQMFMDWLIALCLLYFLHYIMAFALTIVGAICNAVGGDSGASVLVHTTGGNVSGYFTTNLLGLARFQVQYDDIAQKFTYMVLYLALVAYTGVFTWHYLKRVIMMAFLTIIAPLVALTYPIDKMGDGKAQAFNMWLKEYVFNLLIQPFHLVLYTVLVGTSLEIASNNMLYAIACMAFILPAEKFLKKLFGFDRAPLGTMGALTGFTAGALLSKIGNGGSGGTKQVIDGKAGASAANGDKTPRFSKKHGIDGIVAPTNAEHAKLGSGNESGENTDSAVDKNEAEGLNFASHDDKAYMNTGMDTDMDTGMDEGSNLDEIKGNEPTVATPAIHDNGRFANFKQGMKNIKQGMDNVANYHGGYKAMAIKGAKTIGRGAKLYAKTGLNAVGTVAGLGVGLASGKGFSGAVAGAAVGKTLGNRMGNVAGKITKGAGSAVKTTRSAYQSGLRTVDTFKGNTKFQDQQARKQFLNSAETNQYIRDKLTKDNNGVAPTRADIQREKEKMEAYIKEGMYDAKQIYAAQKAEKYGVSDKQSAMIAALAQDRGITADMLADDKKYAAKAKDLAFEFEAKGQSKEDAARSAEYVLNVMKAQNGQAHNLKKPSEKA